MASVLTAARAVNGPRAAAEVEPGARAVRVALLLAEVHVQPRVEQPAEDRAHDGDRMEVGGMPRQAGVADPDLGLDRACPMDDEHATRLDAARVVDHLAVDGVAGPVAEQPLDDREHLVRVDVARDHDRRPAGHERPFVDGPQLGGGERRRRSRRCRRPGGDRARTGRRSSRRTPRRRGGVGRPWPGAGRSGARRAAARPRTPGTTGGGRTSASSSSAGARRLAGTSSPADVASQPASAWIEAPSRSAASLSAIASRTSVPSVSARAARTVAPPSAAGSSAAPDRMASDADYELPPGHRRDDQPEAVRRARSAR